MIAGTVAAMLVAAGLPLRQLGLIVAAAPCLVLIFAILEPYRRARLTAFLNPWATPAARASRPSRARSRSARAGCSGSAPASRCRRSLSARGPHGFILAVIGEELGLAGIGCLLFLTAYRVRRAAHRKKATGVYAKLLAAGLTSLILCQALLNVYAVLGIAPLPACRCRSSRAARRR